MAKAKQQVRNLLNIDKDTSKGLNKEVLFPVSQGLVDFVKQKIGVDISNYQHVIDVSGINHSLKNHGNKKIENQRGQIAVTNEDFEKIPEIITNPDFVEYAGKDGKGKDVIKFTKTDNGVIYVFEEIRTGRKELAFATMYIKRNEQMPKPPLLTSETTSTGKGRTNNLKNKHLTTKF